MRRGRTPRKDPSKDKALNFEDVGRKGRRTGIELKDTGVRDENGMEPMPSFSSPAKPVVRMNGMQHESTYTADDSMDLGQSTIEAPDVVTKTVRNERARLSIPRSVSPRKSLINGSPRRSMPQSAGAMSSPSANLNKGTPKRFVSHPPANRRLDFSVDKTQQSPPKVPQKSTMSTLKPFKQPGSGRKGRKKGGPFDLSATDDEDAGEVDSANETGLINGGDDYTLGGGEEALVDYTEDQENAQDQTIQSIEEEEHFHNPDIDDDDGADATSGAKVPEKKKRGKPPGRKIEANPDESTVSLSTSGPSRRGRPPKKAKSNGVEAQGSEQMMGPPKGKGKRKKSPSEEQNVRKKVAKTVARAPSVRAGSVGARAGNIVQRAETPATDTGALVTRSGRHSFKPLASWRGEKAILGRRTDADSLPAITDIIRTEEVMGPPKGRAAYRRARPRAAPKLEDVEEEEDDMDEWERENGILQAPVMLWDSENGKYMETETEEAEIAFAAGAIEMRDIAGATFKFAKTLTLPFFGSGMVHLPPRGEKRVKNSRKMQMVFFVFYGRVTVTVGSPATPFSIGKGGQWQVPRGNFYSVLNESETQDARMFFAQGCEWSMDNAEEGAAAE